MKRRPLLVALMPTVVSLSFPLVSAHVRGPNANEVGLAGSLGRQQTRDGSVASPTTIFKRDLEDEGDENDEEDNGEAANDDANAAADQAVNDDAVKYYQNNDDGYSAWMNGEYGDEYYGDEAAAGDDTGSSSAYWYANSKNATEKIKTTVSSTAWEFYDTTPHEWTASQWNLVFGLVLSFFTLCCFSAACCAYRCLIAVDEDETVNEEGYPLSPKKGGEPQWSPRRPGGDESQQWSPRSRGDESPRSPTPTSPVARVFAAARHYRGRRKNQRNRRKNRRDFDDDHYRRYQEDVEEDGSILDGDVHVMHLATEEDDETEAVSVNTDAEQSHYEAPRMTTSLAEYTSVQREKEARILEAVREQELRKWKAMRDQEADWADENVVDEESHQATATVPKKTEYDDESDWRATKTAATAQRTTTHDVVVERIYTNDDWKDDAYNVNGIKLDKQQQQPNNGRPKMKSTQELNVALRATKKDKLLEARERKHNFVGYYL